MPPEKTVPVDPENPESGRKCAWCDNPIEDGRPTIMHYNPRASKDLRCPNIEKYLEAKKAEAPTDEESPGAEEAAPPRGGDAPSHVEGRDDTLFRDQETPNTVLARVLGNFPGLEKKAIEFILDQAHEMGGMTPGDLYQWITNLKAAKNDSVASMLVQVYGRALQQAEVASAQRPQMGGYGGGMPPQFGGRPQQYGGGFQRPGWGPQPQMQGYGDPRYQQYQDPNYPQGGQPYPQRDGDDGERSMRQVRREIDGFKSEVERNFGTLADSVKSLADVMRQTNEDKKTDAILQMQSQMVEAMKEMRNQPPPVMQQGPDPTIEALKEQVTAMHRSLEDRKFEDLQREMNRTVGELRKDLDNKASALAEMAGSRPMMDPMTMAPEAQVAISEVRETGETTRSAISSLERSVKELTSSYVQMRTRDKGRTDREQPAEEQYSDEEIKSMEKEVKNLR